MFEENFYLTIRDISKNHDKQNCEKYLCDVESNDKEITSSFLHLYHDA